MATQTIHWTVFYCREAEAEVQSRNTRSITSGKEAPTSTLSINDKRTSSQRRSHRELDPRAKFGAILHKTKRFCGEIKESRYFCSIIEATDT